MSGFWGDVRDSSFDAGESLLKQLAAEKLMREGVIPSVNAPAIAQPSFYTASQTGSAQLSTAPTVAKTNDLADVAVVALVLFAVFVFLGR
jgi:hypothetical protein